MLIFVVSVVHRKFQTFTSHKGTLVINDGPLCSSFNISRFIPE